MFQYTKWVNQMTPIHITQFSDLSQIITTEETYT